MERVTWRLSQEELRAHKFLHVTSVPKVARNFLFIYLLILELFDATFKF